MGGAFRVHGNVNPAAEANALTDCEATDYVFSTCSKVSSRRWLPSPSRWIPACFCPLLPTPLLADPATVFPSRHRPPAPFLLPAPVFAAPAVVVPLPSCSRQKPLFVLDGSPPLLLLRPPASSFRSLLTCPSCRSPSFVPTIISPPTRLKIVRAAVQSREPQPFARDTGLYGLCICVFLPACRGTRPSPLPASLSPRCCCLQHQRCGTGPCPETYIDCDRIPRLTRRPDRREQVTMVAFDATANV